MGKSVNGFMFEKYTLAIIKKRTRFISDHLSPTVCIFYFNDSPLGVKHYLKYTKPSITQI